MHEMSIQLQLQQATYTFVYMWAFNLFSNQLANMRTTKKSNSTKPAMQQ